MPLPRSLTTPYISEIPLFREASGSGAQFQSVTNRKNKRRTKYAVFTLHLRCLLIELPGFIQRTFLILKLRKYECIKS
ncbi:hypothetical protein B1H10_06515 [candidate division KSB1 bacterium 4484_188]|nr:MAG: hypothetical protein B1H10_06515 [candidate division KSB1 bacterium 4484_188]